MRLDAKLDRLLAAEARRQRKTKSQLAREAIRSYLEGGDLLTRAREQSLRASAGEAPELEHDDRGWTG